MWMKYCKIFYPLFSPFYWPGLVISRNSFLNRAYQPFSVTLYSEGLDISYIDGIMAVPDVCFGLLLPSVQLIWVAVIEPVSVKLSFHFISSFGLAEGCVYPRKKHLFMVISNSLPTPITTPCVSYWNNIPLDMEFLYLNFPKLMMTLKYIGRIKWRVLAITLSMIYDKTEFIWLGGDGRT